MNVKHGSPAKPSRAARPLRPRGSARVIEPDARPPAKIVEHPDGYYWLAPDGAQEFGPFKTVALARADHDAYDEEVPSPGESLEEAERELGIGEWIDPDTGELAEGLSSPRLPSD